MVIESGRKVYALWNDKDPGWVCNWTGQVEFFATPEEAKNAIDDGVDQCVVRAFLMPAPGEANAD